MSFLNQLQRLTVMGMVSVTLPLLFSDLVTAEVSQKRENSQIAQAKQDRPEINLNLVVDKQVITVDENGVEQVRWQNVGTQVTVIPGDTLRYVISGENKGNAPANGLSITQPIPRQMVYVMGSATSTNNAVITYSINNGETFVANPTIQVQQPDGTVIEQPAPAEAYTNIRWDFPATIPPNTTVQALYIVQVE